jgi:hypothetical protein
MLHERLHTGSVQYGLCHPWQKSTLSRQHTECVCTNNWTWTTLVPYVEGHAPTAHHLQLFVMLEFLPFWSLCT